MRDMKGMTPEQFCGVQEFVQEYHNFARCISEEEFKKVQVLYPNMNEYGFNIKYIDSIYDSRFRDVWSVTFRGMGREVRFHTNTDLKLEYTNLFDWVMAYLKLEWVPTEEEYKSIK